MSAKVAPEFNDLSELSAKHTEPWVVSYEGSDFLTQIERTFDSAIPAANSRQCVSGKTSDAIMAQFVTTLAS
jgi:hypothetical protein